MTNDIQAGQTLEEQDHLRFVLDSAAIGICCLDIHGACTFCNSTCLELLGYQQPIDLLGSHLYPSGVASEAEGSPSPAAEPVILHTIRQGLEVHADNEVMRRADGTSFPVEYWARPLRSRGQLIGCVVTFLDITDRKLAEEALHEAFEDSKLFMAERQTLESQLRQAQKLEAIGQLAAGIAHEINTPTQYVGDNTKFLKESWKSIAPLLAAAQKMLEDAQTSAESPPIPAHFADCVETADLAYVLEEIPLALDQSLDGLQRIAGIVRAMKEFSHPGSQETQALDINHAIENTIIVARNEWKYVADVRTCFDPNLPLVPCFVAEFNQVILNLLVNAAQAIAGGKGENSPVKGDILITTKLDGNWVEIQIQDSGPGIPEAIRNRIFEPFFTTKPVGGGTGQGLALVHSVIVKKHGGKTWFESEVGKGTTFFVRLPVVSAG